MEKILELSIIGNRVKMEIGTGNGSEPDSFESSLRHRLDPEQANDLRNEIAALVWGYAGANPTAQQESPAVEQKEATKAPEEPPSVPATSAVQTPPAA